MKDCLVVIPARMSSARLPGKPLIDIAGLPMVHHVWNRATSVFSSDDVIIATEDKEIEDYCLSNNLNCMLTNRTFTGEEKVKLVSDKILAKTYICLLGDEPLINTNDLKSFYENIIIESCSTIIIERYLDFTYRYLRTTDPGILAIVIILLW